MPDPSIIRTEFASAEDAADAYGVSRSRVAALRRALTDKEDIKEVKGHSYYLKPGEKRHIKEALARKRSRRKAK
ncbi:MAG TPA: hypothetical protein VI636_08040 [Candidatus Angelobacter sp.]